MFKMAVDYSISTITVRFSFRRKATSERSAFKSISGSNKSTSILSAAKTISRTMYGRLTFPVERMISLMREEVSIFGRIHKNPSFLIVSFILNVLVFDAKD